MRSLFRDLLTGDLVETSNPYSNLVEYSNQGGGRVFCVPSALFHEHFVEHGAPPVWRAAEITGEWLGDAPPVKGYIPDRDWNGWKMPAFTLQQGLRPVCPGLTYDKDADVFVLQTGGGGFDVYAPFEISVDGEILTVYQIGDGWMWEEVA